MFQYLVFLNLRAQSLDFNSPFAFDVPDKPTLSSGTRFCTVRLIFKVKENEFLLVLFLPFCEMLDLTSM